MVPYSRRCSGNLQDLVYVLSVDIQIRHCKVKRGNSGSVKPFVLANDFRLGR